MENTKNKKNWKQRERPALDMSFGKVPPQNREMEEAVLGAIMLEKECFDVVIEILSSEAFYVDAHQRIFSAMEMLAKKNMPIDMLTVTLELITMEELDKVGGMFYITKLTKSVVSGANVETHARIVKQHFLKREFIRIGGEITQDGYDDSVDVFDLQDKADKLISEIINGSRKTVISPMSVTVAESITRIEDLRNKASDITGVDTGFNELNKLTHGWQPTDLIILAARPSVGKTAFAGNLATYAAKSFLKIGEKKSVAFFSLEMSRQQLADRMLSCESGIWLDKIANGKMEDHEMKQLYKKGVLPLSDMPIFIDDTAALNIFELRAKCRRLKNKHNLGLIIIDYLQLMSGVENKIGNREQEISRISRDLKGLAKELKVPIIALSQLSRKTEERKGEQKIPQLSDLRESGAIEQDADMVMFLYRPEYYDITANEMGESNKGKTFVKIAKHRNGALGKIELQALLHIQKFIETDSFEVVKENMRQEGFKSVGSVLNHSEDETPF